MLRALYLTRSQCRYRVEGIGRRGVGLVEEWEQEGVRGDGGDARAVTPAMNPECGRAGIHTHGAEMS